MIGSLAGRVWTGSGARHPITSSRPILPHPTQAWVSPRSMKAQERRERFAISDVGDLRSPCGSLIDDSYVGLIGHAGLTPRDSLRGSEHVGRIRSRRVLMHNDEDARTSGCASRGTEEMQEQIDEILSRQTSSPASSPRGGACGFDMDAFEDPKRRRRVRVAGGEERM